jgi:serine/threonine-protein kinase
MSLQPAKRFGRYELLGKPGFGGMAEAWRARLLGEAGFVKPVFIKKVLPEYSDDYAFTSMLISEARISATLTHSNIAQVFDFGRVDNEYFLAMEFVDGQALYSIIDRALQSGWKSIPVPPAVFIGIELCRGLHYAHTRKDENGKPLAIVHRDISPENVIISYEGQVKIIDFGLAKARDLRGFTTEPGVMKGKYLFFSPEQARGEEVDSLTDVWATGVVLYEMLCGTLPLQGPEYVVLPKLTQGQFPRPREINPKLPQKLEEILMRALATRKQDRYQSCHALGEALSDYLYSTTPRISSQTLAYLVQELFREDMLRDGRDVSVPRSFQEELAGWRSDRRPAPSAPPAPKPEPEEPTMPVRELLRLAEAEPRITAPVPMPAVADPMVAARKASKGGGGGGSIVGGTIFAWLVLGAGYYFFIRESAPPEPIAVAVQEEPSEPAEEEPEKPANTPVATAPKKDVRPTEPAKLAGVPPDYLRFMQQGKTAVEARRYPVAAENYRLALKLDPGSVEAKEGLGMALVLSGAGEASDEEAAKLLREVVTQEASRARAWFGLGMAHQVLRDEDEAVEAYRYYLALEPSGRFALDARRALKQLGED